MNLPDFIMKPCASLGLVCLGLHAAAAPALAQSTSTSPSFSLLHTPAGDLGGGGRVTNAGGTVTADISVGDPASGLVSNVTAGGVRTKGNLIGQLTDPRTASLTAIPATINEGGTRQLTSAATLDDATTLNLTGIASWGIGGPISNINVDTGVVTAGLVFQNTPAQATVNYHGVSASLILTVLNVNLDNFGAYASDGLDDAWQVLYFGPPPNANAGALVDFDGDGQNNLFEYTAGLVPTNPASRFTVTIAPVSGQPTRKSLIFGPRFSDRTYTVKARPDLVIGTWAPLNNPSAPADNGTERTITDLNATGATKFYQVEITKP